MTSDRVHTTNYYYYLHQQLSLKNLYIQWQDITNEELQARPNREQIIQFLKSKWSRISHTLRKSTNDITSQVWTWKSGIDRRRAIGSMARASSQICNESDTAVEISRWLPRAKCTGRVLSMAYDPPGVKGIGRTRKVQGETVWLTTHI